MLEYEISNYEVRLINQTFFSVHANGLSHIEFRMMFYDTHSCWELTSGDLSLSFSRAEYKPKSGHYCHINLCNDSGITVARLKYEDENIAKEIISLLK